MAATPMKSAASLLLVLNFCMYVIVLVIAAWAMNKAIDHGFIIGSSLSLSLSLCVYVMHHIPHFLNYQSSIPIIMTYDFKAFTIETCTTTL